MRVGYLVHSFLPARGGIENFAWGLVRIARDLGHETMVYTMHLSNEAAKEKFEGVQIRRFGEVRKVWPGLPHHVPRGMREAVRQDNLDILHSFEYRNGPPIVAALEGPRHGLPVIWSTAFHPAHRREDEGILRRFYDATAGRLIVSNADLVAFLSRTELSALRRTHPAVARKRLGFLPPLMETAEVRELADRGTVPPELEGKDYVVGLGRFEEYKGFREQVQSLKFLPPSVHLVLIGSFPDSTAKEFQNILGLSKAARRLHIINAAEQPLKYALLRGARALINSSNYESFGIALVEAMALGTPVVSTRTGIATEAIFSHAQLLDSQRPSEIAAKVQRVVAHEKSTSGQLSPAEVEQRFGVEETRKRLKTYYNSIRVP